ncbi:hypothetical protein [Pseudomonas sp. UFMG81]|uniref:hypothetical protein n=1 Tax=Pseudomonas sp. UFMG81 TaxID=2745936 RepID=UPI0018902B3E|nr:hypothetical protein [Pseudomonas sp. UFMG81]
MAFEGRVPFAAQAKMSGSQTWEHPEVEEDHRDGKPDDPRMIQEHFRRWTKATMLSREYIEVVESRERAVVKMPITSLPSVRSAPESTKNKSGEEIKLHTTTKTKTIILIFAHHYLNRSISFFQRKQFTSLLLYLAQKCRTISNHANHASHG